VSAETPTLPDVERVDRRRPDSVAVAVVFDADVFRLRLVSRQRVGLRRTVHSPARVLRRDRKLSPELSISVRRRTEVLPETGEEPNLICLYGSICLSTCLSICLPI